MNLDEQNIDINVKVTGIESIPCLIDTCYQLVVIDGYFENLKTFWDTTNVEILAQKIKNQLNIKDIQGNFLVSNETDTVFGADIDTILAVPHRLAIVKSKFKAKAALGALRGHLITDLVIDEAIANRILLEASIS